MAVDTVKKSTSQIFLNLETCMGYSMAVDTIKKLTSQIFFKFRMCILHLILTLLLYNIFFMKSDKVVFEKIKFKNCHFLAYFVIAHA